MGKIAPSPVLGRASGAYYGVVVANGRNGLVMRRAARYRRAQSDLQKDAAGRMSLVAALWPDLETAVVEAWNEYAETLQRRDRLTGQVYSPTGFNAFTGLACKVLQADPSAPVPLAPPTGVFQGDSLVVTATGLPSAVQWSADAANSSGTTTELLWQELANKNRKPTGRWRTAGFHAFAAGSLTAVVPAKPGWSVIGYRYVETATGRVTIPVTVGRVEVDG